MRRITQTLPGKMQGSTTTRVRYPDDLVASSPAGATSRSLRPALAPVSTRHVQYRVYRASRRLTRGSERCTVW
jgi:hypothetical protein